MLAETILFFAGLVVIIRGESTRDLFIGSMLALAATVLFASHFVPPMY